MISGEKRWKGHKQRNLFHRNIILPNRTASIDQFVVRLCLVVNLAQRSDKRTVDLKTALESTQQLRSNTHRVAALLVEVDSLLGTLGNAIAGDLELRPWSTMSCGKKGITYFGVHLVER